jgi:glycosyltransferase involved in cell wall biosynthesis
VTPGFSAGEDDWCVPALHHLVRRLAEEHRVTVGSSGLLGAARRLRGTQPLLAAPLGVDTSLFCLEGAKLDLGGEPRLLQVGSLSPIKNHRLSIAAFAEVAGSHPSARLHLVGSGPLHDTLADQARSLGLEDRVLFHGEVPHHQLPAFYRAADLNISSLRFESQGMTVLEAAACGTGSVGTEVGILTDLGEAAVTAPVGDPNALAAALKGVLERRSRVRVLGDAARDRIVGELGLERCVARLTDLYGDPDGTSGRRSPSFPVGGSRSR